MRVPERPTTLRYVPFRTINQLPPLLFVFKKMMSCSLDRFIPSEETVSKLSVKKEKVPHSPSIECMGHYHLYADHNNEKKEILLARLYSRHQEYVPLFSKKDRNESFLLSGVSGIGKTAFLERLTNARAIYDKQTFVLDTDGCFFGDRSTAEPCQANSFQKLPGYGFCLNPFAGVTDWEKDREMIVPIFSLMLNKPGRLPLFKPEELDSALNLLWITRGRGITLNDLFITLDTLCEDKGLTKDVKERVLDTLEQYRLFFSGGINTIENKTVTIVNFGWKDRLNFPKDVVGCVELLWLYRLVKHIQTNFIDDPLIIIDGDASWFFLELGSPDVVAFFEKFVEAVTFDNFSFGYSTLKSMPDIERTPLGKVITSHAATYFIMRQLTAAYQFIDPNCILASWYADNAKGLTTAMRLHRSPYPPTQYTDLCIKKENFEATIKFVLNDK